MNLGMSGIAIWITGLPGSGKSTVAEHVIKAHPEFMILRMDVFRKFVTPVPTYTDTERNLVYRALIYFAKVLTDIGHNVIIDATGNRRIWRELARKEISKFIEVYLRCPLEICADREKKRLETKDAPKDIYEKAKEGWPVPGISVPYEEPVNPEIIADTDKESLSEVVNKISRTLTEKSGVSGQPSYIF